MLTPSACRLMSSSDKVPTAALRLFLWLLSEFDLSVYRALSSRKILELYPMPQLEFYRSMSDLVSIGLLEEGPMKRNPHEKLPVTAYRVGLGFLLSPEAMENHFRECDEREQRATLAPRQHGKD
jgi:hypothetical protein